MALEAPQEDAVSISEGHLRSRGPNGPPRSGKSGKNGAPQIEHDPVSVARPSAEPWPDVARSQERDKGSTSVETTGHLSVRALKQSMAGLATLLLVALIRDRPRQSTTHQGRRAPRRL